MKKAAILISLVIACFVPTLVDKSIDDAFVQIVAMDYQYKVDAMITPSVQPLTVEKKIDKESIKQKVANASQTLIKNDLCIELAFVSIENRYLLPIQHSSNYL
ncbi:hypothetical protein [Metabacillus iocasae]|uniref:Uncharacterized protein n=1 Tax=Priestia iocasae TaxID=2291674 RepID=A0ABS2QY63_9BACI|nr:hypothetical protein [Metabacillus iocasae]MBM7703414.1 hypothetical protein [Metabacillus iocasae]